MTPGHTSLFNNVTSFNYYFNFRLPREPKEFTYYFHFLDTPAVRKAIHVGHTIYHNSRKVQSKIFPDMAKSVKTKVEDILNKGLKVLNGSCKQLLLL
jgi:vitellogenic carboxypeptidase-like protein